MIISLISFLGLIFGYFLAKNFKQELNQVNKFIKIMLVIVIILLVITLTLLAGLNLKFIIAIIVGILISLLLKRIYFYFGLALMLSNFTNSSNKFSIAILIFIYGLLFSSLNFKKINAKFILINLILFILPFTLLLFKEFTLQNSNIILGFTIGGLSNGVKFTNKKNKK